MYAEESYTGTRSVVKDSILKSLVCLVPLLLLRTNKMCPYKLSFGKHGWPFLIEVEDNCNQKPGLWVSAATQPQMSSEW